MIRVLEFPKETTDFSVRERFKECEEYMDSNTVVNAIVVLVCSDGTVVDCWANRNNPFVMVGALESIKKEFMDNCIEER